MKSILLANIHTSRPPPCYLRFLHNVVSRKIVLMNKTSLFNVPWSTVQREINFACNFPYIKATSLLFDLRPDILNGSFVALIDRVSPTGSGLWKGLLDTSRNQLGTCNPVIAVMAWFVTITTMVTNYSLIAGNEKMAESQEIMHWRSYPWKKTSCIAT